MPTSIVYLLGFTSILNNLNIKGYLQPNISSVNHKGWGIINIVRFFLAGIGKTFSEGAKGQLISKCPLVELFIKHASNSL